MVATRRQFSSGGVIFRRDNKKVMVALIGLRNGMIWCLPKGMMEKNESPDQTARREVKEETGLEGRVLGKIGDIDYWYYSRSDRTRYHKTVSFFLLEYLSGDTRDHDYEVDKVRWVTLDEAYSLLKYEGEREILSKARDVLAAGS